MDPPMKINGDPKIIADRGSYRADTADDLVHLTRSIDIVELSASIHLDGFISLRLPLFSGVGYFCRFITTDPSVDLHPISHFTPQHLMHTQTVPPAFEIPKRLIYSRQRAHQNRAASIKPSAVEYLPNVFDLIRISAQHVMP